MEKFVAYNPVKLHFGIGVSGVNHSLNSSDYVRIVELMK